jgi:amino acid transporter
MEHRFFGGFFLSIPFAFTYFVGFDGFGNLSEAANNLWLAFMGVLFLVTLPGSLILFLTGFVAAFSGKTGESIVASCIFLSVANAHMMGMFYYGWFFKKRAKHGNGTHNVGKP